MDHLSILRIQTYSESKNSFFYKLIKKIILDAREKFFDYFKILTEYNDNKSLLDIGTTPSLDSEQNVILEKTKNNKNITCFSDQDCSILEKKYPNIKDFIIFKIIIGVKTTTINYFIRCFN